MSSPVSELLVQESVCTELFKSISESIETPHQDDVIGHLFDQMIQILPPEERSIFGCAEVKNIEEIIQEANELIQATTPLYSSSDSCEKSTDKSPKVLSKQIKTSEYSSIKENSEEVDYSSKEKTDSDSIFSSLESILVKESVSNMTPTSQDTSFVLGKPEKPNKSESYSTNIFGKDEDQLENIMEMISLEDKSDARSATTKSNKIAKDSSNPDDDVVKTKQNLNLLSEANAADDLGPQTNHFKIENKSQISLQSPNFDQKEPASELQYVEQEHIAEIQELKLLHNKEINGLTQQIHVLNNKIYEFQKHSEVNKSPDLKNQQLEHFESEMKHQEQLISGYERENRKLCKEIAALKETWKQRENKLAEEKQKLKNELQGMVSKSSTEALEEQLKDAKETIVKLQIELTTHKSKNKELEAQCERLRGETHRLQGELGKCHCDRLVNRRDKYSFLASSNVGAQIQELKNVIARKDVEIAQMTTTLGILKGELNNKELMVPLYNPQLESQSLTVSQLQSSLTFERQTAKDLCKEKDLLIKDNLDLKRQVRELESIVKRRQKSDSVFPVIADAQSSTRLLELERELSSRQESLSALHTQFLAMQKKYENHIEELEKRLEESRKELQALKSTQKKEEASNVKPYTKKLRLNSATVKEETHLLATIRGLRQEAAVREKEISKLNKEIEDVRQTNRKLQKEREKQLNSMPSKMLHIKEKASLRKAERPVSAAGSRSSTISSHNNNRELNPIIFGELQDSNLILKSKNKSLQEEVKRLEQDLITMHNKRAHDII